MGFEPTTLGTTTRYSNQLNYSYHFEFGVQICSFFLNIQKIFALFLLYFVTNTKRAC